LWPECEFFEASRTCGALAHGNYFNWLGQHIANFFSKEKFPFAGAWDRHFSFDQALCSATAAPD
jgi:hypothetical protein